MEVLQFKLSGKSAFFKKPEVNTYGYFTYGNIHKIALLGILGAILGYKGYGNPFKTINKKKKMDLKPSYPDFYDNLRDLKISILPYKGVGTIPKKMQSFNNSVGYASQEKGGNLIVKQQWLENPAWIICILLDCERANEVKNALEHKICEFYPYLGSNDHFADITDVQIRKASKIEQEYYHIDSFILKDNVVWLDEDDIDEEDSDNQAEFKYEEALPYLLDSYTNNYILKKFMYTGWFIDVKDTAVYKLAADDNNDEKQIVFY